MSFCKHLSLRAAAFTAIAVLASAGVAQADTINLVNGGFEMTSLTTSSQFGSTFGGQTVTGWTGSGYTFLYLPGTADSTGATGQYGTAGTSSATRLWGPNDGSNNGLSASPLGGNYVALDGAYEDGSISQVLTGLTVGAATTVSFDYAGAQQSGYTGITTEAFLVSLGTQTLETPILTNSNHGFTGWQNTSLTFTPTSTTETLTFLAQGTPTGEPPFTLLDGVTVNSTAVTPEPSSLALFGTGLVTIGGVLRKRFAKA